MTMNLRTKDSLCSHDHFSCRRSLKELPHLRDDDSGYIEGKVFMMWPPRHGLHRINIEVTEDTALYRFELEVPHRDGIAFRPHERICFALKGAKADTRKESSAPHYFPITLRYPDGVVLKYLTGANAGKVIDTWMGNTDEWYDPGKVHTVSDVVTIDAPGIHYGPIPAPTCLLMQTSPRRDSIRDSHGGDVNTDCIPLPLISVTDGAPAVQSKEPAQDPSIERPNRSFKMRARRRRKLKKGQESTFSNHTSGDGVQQIEVPMLSHQQRHASIKYSKTRFPDNHSKVDISGNANAEASVTPHDDNRKTMKTMSGEAGAPALRLKAGIRTERGDTFTALNDLQRNHSLVNIIGIVTSVNPERKTRTNEWGRSFTLVDPSTFDLPRQSITVNCFQKKYLEWLPQVHKDDIIILRKLKVVEFNDAIATTGHGDKLRWAVYDPLKHSVRPPNRGNAPEKESIDDGLGYEFSPYWEPFQDSVELMYCRQIGEWWRALRNCEGQKVSAVVCSVPPTKQHLLVSQASPDLPPKGFFNCTVQVLQKFNSWAGAITVYVTDYTTNSLIHPVQAPWCPPELSNHVLQCTMWDEARDVAEIMNPGEYWYFHNVRAKWNPSHYMEGTMRLAEKVTQLDETKLEAQPHLRALLERRKGFGLNESRLSTGSAPSHIFPHKLIQDVDISTSFLTCAAELVHFDLNSQDGHFIYITDYTYNPDLPAAVCSDDWARNLQHYVMKIKLDDTQAKMSPNLKPGSTYIIRNLRIKHSSVSGGVHGCLGGEDVLIVSLDDLSSHEAQTLRKNKEKWNRENMLNVPTASPHERSIEFLGQSPATLDAITLQEALMQSSPNVFRVLARAVDFFPFSLEDSCMLRCTRCESRPPPSFKRCPRCDDMMETHSKWFYCLYILIEDEKGGELVVSLSGKECALLLDVNPTDFRCDYQAFRRFLAKLDPILGNLRDVHVAWAKNEHKVIESPLMLFTVESWSIGDEKGYGLLDCVPVPPKRAHARAGALSESV